MHYEQRGSGDNLLLISGYGADHTVWEHVISVFSKSFTVTTFDNRGAGFTDASNPPYTLQQMVDDVLGLMDILQIEDAHVLGHSMGGKIALKFAANHPNRVKKLVLASTKASSIAFPLSYIEDISSEFATYSVPNDLIMRNFFAWLYSADFLAYSNKPKYELARALKQASFFSDYGRLGQRAAVNEDLVSDLEKIVSPALVLCGDEDILINPIESKSVSERIKDSVFVSLDKCAHMPQIEKPKEFSQHVIDFLIK